MALSELHLNPHLPPRLLAGLDLGQVSDPTALALAEREMILGPTGRMEPRFLVRFLERVPLRTSYPDVKRGVRKRLTALGEPCSLILDATGVGRAVADIFKDPATDDEQQAETAMHPRFRLPRRLAPICITLTAGLQATQVSYFEWHVPKRDVVMTFSVALQQNRVWVAEALPDAATLLKEAHNFTWKPTKAGNDEYGAWREGQHDDLLLAVAILVWWGDKYAPRYAHEQGEVQAKAIATGNPLIRPERQQVAVGTGRVW